MPHRTIAAILFVALLAAGLCRAQTLGDRRPDAPQAPRPVAAEKIAQAVLDGSPYVTPETYGAVGDDKKDDTEAIQKLFAERHGKVIVIPGKRYLISDTIVIPKRAGFHVIGAGFNAGGINPRHSMMGNASRLVWIGPDDRPMVVSHGRGLIWNGVELHGRPWYRNEPERPRAKIGFLVAKQGRGIGVGKQFFPAMAIYECENGFQAGTTEGEHNCDNLIFGYLSLGNCTYGFRTRNHMAMDLHFQYVKGGGKMDALFYFERGGAAHIQGLGMHSRGVKTLMKIGWNGRNNGFFSINNAKIDAQASELKMIEMEQPCPSVITISKLKRSWLDKRPTEFEGIFDLKGSAVLTIRDSQHVVGPQSFVTSPDNNGNVPNVILDRCDLPAGTTPESLRHPKSKGDWHFAIRNCYREGGHAPVKDVDNHGD